jgi:hypothetical protein
VILPWCVVKEQAVLYSRWSVYGDRHSQEQE